MTPARPRSVLKANPLGSPRPVKQVVHLSGRLDLDHLGAEFAQHPDALRHNGGDTELDDPYPGEQERRRSTAGGGNDRRW